MTPHEETMRRLAYSMTHTLAFLDWDQQKIAVTVGISRPMLSHLLHGKRRITYGHLIALCKALCFAYSEAMNAQEIPAENNALLQAEHLVFFKRLYKMLEWVIQEIQATNSSLQQDVETFGSRITVLIESLSAKGSLTDSERREFKECCVILPRVIEDYEQLGVELTPYLDLLEKMKETVGTKKTQLKEERVS